jgi:hypothetical protein
LTTGIGVGILANMDAVLVRQTKIQVGEGYLVEIVVWVLPAPVPGSTHRFKYRLFYGNPDGRIVGYDNERGKGDHKHILGEERPYTFSSVDQLLADFRDDVDQNRRHQ